jgi:hypothetical protein
MAKACCANCTYGERPVGSLWKKLMAPWPAGLVCVRMDKRPGTLGLVAGEWKCGNFRVRRPSRRDEDPPVPPNADYRYIQLTKGKYAVVDAADYERLAKHKWYALQVYGSQKVYAYRTENGKAISMHREIMQPPPGKVVDHIDGDGIYNRRRNMRNCTLVQNAQNTRRPVKEGKASRYIGVFPRGDKWRSRFRYNGKTYYLGTFDAEVDAAMARDRKAIELAGEYATLNFPQELLEARWPELKAYRRNPSAGATLPP